VEEENGEDASDTAAKIGVKNSIAPWERGNVLRGFLRNLAEQTSVLFIVPDNISRWGQTGSDLLALKLDRSPRSWEGIICVPGRIGLTIREVGEEE
jgi:hypothetical protein